MGGPADEFRFFCDENVNPVRIESWFLDWFDGAHLTLSGKEFEILAEIFRCFKECGAVKDKLD